MSRKIVFESSAFSDGVKLDKQVNRKVVILIKDIDALFLYFFR